MSASVQVYKCSTCSINISSDSVVWRWQVTEAAAASASGKDGGGVAKDIKKVLDQHMDTLKKAFDDVKPPLEWVYREVVDTELDKQPECFSSSTMQCGAASCNVVCSDHMIGKFMYSVLVKVENIITACASLHTDEDFKNFCLATVEEAAREVAYKMTLEACLELDWAEAAKRINTYLADNYAKFGFKIWIKNTLLDKCEELQADVSDRQRYRRRGFDRVQENKKSVDWLQSNADKEKLRKEKVAAYHTIELAEHNAQLQRDSEEKTRATREKDVKTKYEAATKSMLDKMAMEQQVALQKVAYDRALKEESAKYESKEAQDALPADARFIARMIGKEPTFDQLLEWRRVEVALKQGSAQMRSP
jgi:hypothetical protein